MPAEVIVGTFRTPQAAPSPHGEGSAFTDWSSLMSAALADLKRAEDELRLYQMHTTHLMRANQHVLKAQMKLLELTDWICAEDQE